MPRAKRQREPSTAVVQREIEAAKACRVALELEEDGDAEYALQCVQHAISRAREAAGEAASFDESAVAEATRPPVGLILSVGLATLGRLRMQHSTAWAPSGSDENLDAARVALEASIRVWPGNATALSKLGDLELHHGCLGRAMELYDAAARLPPIPSALAVAPAAVLAAAPECDDGTADWHAAWLEQPRAEAVGQASYMLSLLLHLSGRCDEAVPHLRRLGVRLRLSPGVWAAVVA